MSRTRIPVNGSVGESAAAVARSRQKERLEPLRHTREIEHLANLKDDFEISIAYLN